MERFIVDQRVGCAALIDTRHYDATEPGLEPDTPGVVKYVMGTYNGVEWTVDGEQVARLHTAAELLNLS